MPENPTHPFAARPPDPEEVATAYEATKPELDALLPNVVGRVTTDIPTAVSLMLGAKPTLEALISALESLLKDAPIIPIQRIEQRALALLYTEIQFVPKGDENLQANLDEAQELRAQLLAAADAHVMFGQMNGAAVAKIREGAGHLDRAKDLIALGGLFRAAWPVIATQTQATREKVERASVLGTILIAQLGGKTLGTGGAGVNWADQRNRAFRLFMNDYDAIRRAVEYLRYYEKDAADFLPLLHRRSTKSSQSSGSESTEDAANRTDLESLTTGRTDVEETE
jgi:hypothetical protein